MHDPQMANEREVKAEVKLRFRNVNGERMIVGRKLQVTAKKGASHTMKTLEGYLSYADERGEQNKVRTAHRFPAVSSLGSDCSQCNSSGGPSPRDARSWTRSYRYSWA